MGILNDVLEYKARKEAQEAQAYQAIPNAIAGFIQGREKAQENQLKMLTLNAELATKGIKLNPDGTFARDTSLESPMESLLQQAKVAEAAKTMGNRPLWEALTGAGSGVSKQAVVPQLQPTSTIDQMQAPEVDQFTGKLTDEGVRQETRNKLIEAQGLEKAKTEAKNAEKVKGMEAIEGDLNSLLNLYKEIPENLKGPIEGRTFGVGAKLLGSNTALNTYEDARGLVLANISREFGGEKGVLTDRDIKRIEDAFPSKIDTPEIASKKIEFIRDFVGRKIEVKTKSARSSDKESKSNIDNDPLGLRG